MDSKKLLILATGLALILAGTACKRHDVAQPSPVGPSTLATILKVSANPNVINAGTVRSGTTISASLMKFDGTPLTNRTVTFEIRDAAGNQVNVGFFEGQEFVVTRQTDGGGTISLTYYGPLDSDITDSTSVQIWATVASEGDEFIENFAPVTILRDGSSTTGVLDLSANPNVIFAGDQRQSTTITASLSQIDGTPLANRAVIFEICDASHNRVNVGFFEGQVGVLSRTTDSRGMITVTYFGPLNSDIAASTSVTIFATAAGEGAVSIQGFAPITIIRDDSSSALVLDISADPNVLNAGTVREHATILATVKKLSGAPLANRAVYFEINDAEDKRAYIGYFEGQNPVATAVTDSEGRAQVTYFAPIKSEIGRSVVLHIWASTAGEGTPFIQKYVEVYIIR
jgi:hypothetical protein